MADALKDVPFKTVQVDALVAIKIATASGRSFPSLATGSLVGMEKNGVLEITNSFPYPEVSAAQTDGQNNDSAASLAAGAPRLKANIAYGNEMIKFLREVNVDANNVGWYTSTSMGNFVNLNTIENQYFYQSQLNERTVALVYDVSRSSQGTLNLRAYRLSPSFVTAYKEGKFTTESLQKSSLRYQDILVELPVTVRNSHLLTSLLHQLPSEAPKEELTFPPNLAALQQDPNTPLPPLFPNYDALDLSIDPFLEKTCDLLLESIENHHTELNNYQYYQRSLAREQTKITAWQQKRKAENAARTASKQPLLPEDEWQRLFKLPQEPSRLETLLNSRQVEQYSRQVDGFAAGVTSKMFAVKSNLLPGE
ncbi:Mov34/MPN/PAD-1 family protein [Ophiobolus disseminans]|uniref:Eukaryotic translation initiation factor 3 subunit H n=1 Tax=Ophiobolus disseminans TaxID=1469910 RepID=A0A6A7AJ94_9PLEO|nr:Mov34/MPN/PAD-1 family protein [Ophiobolus disseminans]